MYICYLVLIREGSDKPYKDTHDSPLPIQIPDLTLHIKGGKQVPPVNTEITAIHARGRERGEAQILIIIKSKNQGWKVRPNALPPYRTIPSPTVPHRH